MSTKPAPHRLYPERSSDLRGALCDVYNALGPGFRDQTHKFALLEELRGRGIAVACDDRIPVRYKSEHVDEYQLDLVVDGKIIVERKAVDALHPRHHAPLMSNQRASGLHVGRPVNFGAEGREIVRRALGEPDPD